MRWHLVLAAGMALLPLASCEALSIETGREDLEATEAGQATASIASALATEIAPFLLLIPTTQPPASPATQPLREEPEHDDWSVLEGLIYRTGDSLWRIDPGGPSLLASDPALVSGQVAQTPGGIAVLYVEDRDIRTRYLDTGMDVNLTQTPEIEEREPQWCPERPDRILFRRVPHPGTPAASGTLGMVGTDGTGYEVLGELDESIWFSSSPDCGAVAYTFARSAWVWRWETGGEVLEPADYGLDEIEGWLLHDPAWSPDGALLAWVATAPTMEFPALNRVVLFDLESRAGQYLEPPGETGPYGWMPGMVWSPDGRWLVYYPGDRQEGGQWLREPQGFWVARVGSTAHPINLGFHRNPNWSPDSRRLAYPDTETVPGALVLRVLRGWTWEETAAFSLPPDSEILGWQGLAWQTSPTPSPPGTWQSYTSEEGGFSINYPASLEVLEGTFLSVDGVFASVADTITLLDPEGGPFAITITFTRLEPGTTPMQLALESRPCVAEGHRVRTVLLGESEALLFEDTPCGPYGTSVFFLVQGQQGFVIEITAHRAFVEVEGEVLGVLGTFRVNP